jgi:HSP20 family protein
MSTQMHQVRGPLADIYDWLEWPLMALRPGAGHLMRAEDYHHGHEYVLRVEIPGVDPEKDIDLTAADGVITVKAERHKDGERRHHSEFQYGHFSRSFALPANADESRIMAVYSHGILEICVCLTHAAPKHAEQRIPVKVDHHIRPS